MIHQYKLGGYNIVLDVCSGSVHVVDEVAYEIIALFETHDRETVLKAMAEKFAHRSDITEADIAECYNQVVALKDAKVGLIENSVGIMPGGGGIKELLAREMKDVPAEENGHPAEEKHDS